MSESAMLRCEGICAGYGDVSVLHEVSVSVERGSIEALLGPNGAGKTTFAATVLGLVVTTAGRIYFRGVDITAEHTYVRVKRGIGLVQEGKRVFRLRTVIDNLTLGAIYVARRERAERIEEVLELFPALSDMRLRRAGELSGGQQQMLAIGQALMGRPELLILDEPSAGLAPTVVDDVFEAIVTLKQRGLSIVLIEQLVERALEIADHVTVLSEGRRVLGGRVEEMSENDQLLEAYFGGSL